MTSQRPCRPCGCRRTTAESRSDASLDVRRCI